MQCTSLHMSTPHETDCDHATRDVQSGGASFCGTFQNFRDSSLDQQLCTGRASVLQGLIFVTPPLILEGNRYLSGARCEGVNLPVVVATCGTLSIRMTTLRNDRVISISSCWVLVICCYYRQSSMNIKSSVITPYMTITTVQ